MREDATEQYLAYKLIDSNQDWKSKWFYITNHHLELPKPSGKQPKHRLWWNSEPTMQFGYPATRTAGEDQGFKRSRAKGQACGLQLHEEEGAATDGSQHLGLPVHR
jgi:hypothetical protein